MNRIVKFIKPLAGIIVLGILIYFFPEIFVYFAIAIILFMLGRPLCEQIKKFHIKKFHLGSSVSAILTMLVMLLIISLIFFLIIPLINKEVNILTKIDSKAIVEYFKVPLTDIYNYLVSHNIIRPENEIVKTAETKLYQLINWDNFTNIFGKIISATSSIFIGIFSVIFITFFLLREPKIVHNIFMAISPEKYELRMNTILHDSRVMLTRYIFGVIAELLCMMILILIGLSIFGIENALIIAVIGGFMNIIPYLGPLMGCAIGTIIGIISNLGLGIYDMILPNSLEIIGVFIISNFIDNFVLQPTIYSKSVIAHPIEIFLVILMAGKIGGIIGMIIAIPSYTIIRIIAKQLLSQFKFIDLLTKNMKIPNDKVRKKQEQVNSN